MKITSANKKQNYNNNNQRARMDTTKTKRFKGNKHIDRINHEMQQKRFCSLRRGLEYVKNDSKWSFDAPKWSPNEVK